MPGKSGITKVDEVTYDRRLSACLQCPHLRKAPSASDRVWVTSMNQTSGLCVLSGAPVERKAKFPTEVCPDRDFIRDGLTRWGEPPGPRPF
jgi:hypothetical protein